MIYLYQHDYNTNISTYVAQNEDELNKLPTKDTHGTFLNADVHQYAHMGDACLVLSTSTVYMYDGADDTWKLLASNSSGGEDSPVSSTSVSVYPNKEAFPAFGTENNLYYDIENTTAYIWIGNEYKPVGAKLNVATVDETLTYLGIEV